MMWLGSERRHAAVRMRGSSGGHDRVDAYSIKLYYAIGLQTKYAACIKALKTVAGHHAMRTLKQML
jgi:hypothetical protein